MGQNCPAVYTRFVNDNVCAPKDIIWNVPLLLETFHGGHIHDEMNRDLVGDGYLGWISAM